jgi:hypothetical protein
LAGAGNCKCPRRRSRMLTYKSIASIIANKLERSSRDTEDAIIEHPNLRGPGYFGLHGMAKGFKDLDAQPEARSLEHAEWL